MQKYIDFKEKIDNEKLKEVAQIIKNGGVVVFPTDTVYGVGVDGLNSSAIEKLYQVKNRPLNKPICLLVSDMKMIKDIAKDISDIEYKLMKEFFPGPFTIILKKKNIVPDILTANADTVGIRIPDSEIAKKLIELVGGPIATSSANISGQTSGTNIDDIIEDIGEQVDCIIDGGKSKLGIGSTIVKVIDGEPKILRQGSITEKNIIESL